MTKRVLFSWIGATDLRAAQGDEKAGLGPVAGTLASKAFDEARLLCDYPPEKADPYFRWLEGRRPTAITRREVELPSPMAFGEIYEAASTAVAEGLAGEESPVELSFLLSSGTSAMAAVWILLAKGRFRPAELVQSSPERGVERAEVPFDIYTEVIPGLLDAHDRRIETAAGLPRPDIAGFSDIVHRSESMGRVIERAARVAPRKVTVLIEGESGTGKELLAQAIHRAGPRRGKLVALNCAALSETLIESELFGHKRGAFTGAVADRKGKFEEASRGTLFLDEVGELSLDLQAKLLRAVQEEEITPLGSNETRRVDVRLLAATNRDLRRRVEEGEFREDLFYRLARAVLRVPPLRDRAGCLGPLTDFQLSQVNDRYREDPLYGEEKSLSPAARALLADYPWPGNVRELFATIERVALWTPGSVIGPDDLRDALIPGPRAEQTRDSILGRPVEQGVDLPAIIDQVKRHYLSEALRVASGNKTKATELVKLSNPVTFTNWLRKLGMES